MAVTDALHRPLTRDRRRFDAGANALVGSRCPACQASAWPGRALCHRCGSAVEEWTFARRGTLLSYTEVSVPMPGLEVPYTLGQVRLDDGPIVYGRVVTAGGELSLPGAVETRIDGDRYWFRSRHD